MTMQTTTGPARIVQRHGPDTDIEITLFTATYEDEDGAQEHRVKVGGFEPVDYLTAVEARQMARALIAAVDELTQDAS
ncbi:hypothetical protein ABW17_12105 [Mycobacterium nebraskense]|uniref:hypothetical protein n=1 Tax=Mycobacterium nebraskense TaxID=244292 RepID=UPI000641CEB0|nr:hypothetical protein [Mycobacterium nebraskense]KLO42380.1 hypothetical protein ABW17_12105 [Mycobacterium nebraskense]